MIYWLEDQELTDDLVTPVVDSIDGIEVTKCKNLSDLNKILISESHKCTGLIIDLALADTPTLVDVGFPDVATSDGQDAGFYFLAHCVRNYDDNKLSPYGNSLRHLPVLILTSMRKSTLKLRYRDWTVFEEDKVAKSEDWGRTDWRSKPDYNGIEAFQTFFKAWVVTCRNYRA